MRTATFADRRSASPAASVRALQACNNALCISCTNFSFLRTDNGRGVRAHSGAVPRSQGKEQRSSPFSGSRDESSVLLFSFRVRYVVSSSCLFEQFSLNCTKIRKITENLSNSLLYLCRMRKLLCPQCKIAALYVKNDRNERLLVYVMEDGEIVPKYPADSMEGFDLTEVYCLGCSWHGSPKRLVKR